MKGGRVWQRTTVYVLGQPAGEYGIVQMRAVVGTASCSLSA